MIPRNNFGFLDIIFSRFFYSGFVVIARKDVKEKLDHKNHEDFISDNKLSSLENKEVWDIKTSASINIVALA